MTTSTLSMRVPRGGVGSWRMSTERSGASSMRPLDSQKKWAWFVGARIEIGPVGTDPDLAEQADVREQVQRIVDGGRRDRLAGRLRRLAQRLGRDVPVSPVPDQQVCEREPLAGYPDAAPRQPIAGGAVRSVGFHDRLPWMTNLQL